MSSQVISHHFGQQRKATVAPYLAAKDALKPSTPSSTKESLVAVVTPPSASSPSIAELARAARQDTYGWVGESDEEVLLRKFDLAMEYGPNTGVSRLQRWQRAEQFGLRPPAYVPEILRAQAFKNAPPTPSEVDVEAFVQPEVTKRGAVGSHSLQHNHVM